MTNNNVNGAIKDSETLKMNLDALRISGIHDLTSFVINTLKRTDGEKYLLKFVNHIENDQNFKRAIELFQSNIIENKCLELMACTDDMQYETSINLVRNVMQLPNEGLLETFVNKLCTLEYSLNLMNLMEIFLIEPHQKEFIASELIREAYVTSMETMLQREVIYELVSFGKYLFDSNASTELIKKCCDNFRGFFNLVKTVITKHSTFIEHLETDDGDLFWYFRSENFEGNIKFNDFARFICNLASPPELNFTYKFLIFLKSTFPPKLLNHIFAKYQ